MLARRILAALLAVIAAVPFFGVIDLATLVGWADPSYRWPVPVEVSWGGFFTFVVGGAYLSLVVAHDPRPGVAQLALAAAALLVAAAAGLDGSLLAIAAVIGISAVLLLLLGGGQAAPGARRWSVHWPYALLAAAAVALWLPYTLSALAQSRAGAESDVTNGIQHWPVQGATGAALLLGAVVLALWRPARPLLPATLTVTGALIGIAALAYPDRIGATEGPAWAVAVLLWSLALALAPGPRKNLAIAGPASATA